MSRLFASASARPPERVYIEGVVVLDDGEAEYNAAVGLGFGGIHYIEHPNAFVLGENNYAGAYHDIARFINRRRAPRKPVITVPWPQVCEWTLDKVHDEVLVSLQDGRNLRILLSKYQAADFYEFGLKARATA